VIERLLNSTRAALLINEMQLGIAHPDYAMFKAMALQAQERGIAPRIARLAEAFRAAALPVFHLPCIHRRDLSDIKKNSLISAMSHKFPSVFAGTPQAEFFPELQPHDEDHISVRSSGIFAFLGTDLNVRLRRMGVETVVATGVSTNLGIPGLAIAGVDYGYNVIVPEDCIAGSDPQVHRIIVDEQIRLLATVTTSDDILAAMPARASAK